MEDLQKRTSSARSLSKEHGTQLKKNNREYKVIGNKSHPSKKFWSESKEVRIQIAMPK